MENDSVHLNSRKPTLEIIAGLASSVAGVAIFVGSDFSFEFYNPPQYVTQVLGAVLTIGGCASVMKGIYDYNKLVNNKQVKPKRNSVKELHERYSSSDYQDPGPLKIDLGYHGDNLPKL